MTQRELLVHKKGKGGGEAATMRSEQLTRCWLEGKASWLALGYRGYNCKTKWIDVAKSDLLSTCKGYEN